MNNFNQDGSQKKKLKKVTKYNFSGRVILQSRNLVKPGPSSLGQALVLINIQIYQVLQFAGFITVATFIDSRFIRLNYLASTLFSQNSYLQKG